MAEYIEREALLASIKNLKHYLNTGIARHNLTQKDIMKALETFPKADVVEVRHGEWEPRMQDDGYGEYLLYFCSECGAVSPNMTRNYCQNCGCRMDKGGE